MAQFSLLEDKTSVIVKIAGISLRTSGNYNFTESNLNSSKALYILISSDFPVLFLNMSVYSASRPPIKPDAKYILLAFSHHHLPLVFLPSGTLFPRDFPKANPFSTPLKYHLHLQLTFLDP